MVNADFRPPVAPQPTIADANANTANHPKKKTNKSKRKQLSPEEIAKQEKAVKVANLQSNKIHILRPAVTKDSIFSRIAKKLNPFVFMGNVINKFSILRGTLKGWDSTRLLAGKHVSFDQIGATHLQLKSKNGDVVDATYLEASTLANKLEKFGGQRVEFKPNFNTEDPYERKEVNVSLKNGTSFKALHISLTALAQHNWDKRPLEEYYATKKMVIIQDKEGEFYAIPRMTYNSLMKAKQIKEDELSEDISDKQDVGENELELAPKGQQVTTKFTGYYFEKSSPELKTLLDNLEISKTPWILKEYGDKAFLVKRADLPNIDLCYKQNASLENLEMKKAIPVESSQEQGTVLLSMNQTEVYEQYTSEFLTFALAGVNVMAYNNGGKGLSKGGSDINSINDQIETAYQYLKNIKQVPDNKILAKGQCFGGAPTAWLGRQHPNINIMMDQSPANFYDVAAKIMKDKIAPKENDDSISASIRRGIIRALGLNYIIDGIAKAIMAGYDSPKNLSYNRGHKLIHHNIPNEFGGGGDKLVPDVHIEKLKEAADKAEPKYSPPSRKRKDMSYNPGGIHVSHWFSNPTSYTSVMNFIHEAGLASNMFEIEENALEREE